MAEEVTTPRIVYKGANDDTAQTKRVEDQADLDAAIKDGWRLHREGANAPVVDLSGRLAIPAQDVVVDRDSAKTEADLKARDKHAARDDQKTRDQAYQQTATDQERHHAKVAEAEAQAAKIKAKADEGVAAKKKKK